MRRFATGEMDQPQASRHHEAAALPVRAEPCAPPAPFALPATGVLELPQTPGAHYLKSRGIPDDLAGRCARYAPSWSGYPAVLFPVRNLSGLLVGVHGRYVGQHTGPKARSLGAIADGVFSTPGALEAPVLVITEAPIDALSLAAAGMPAVALCGTAFRPWLAEHYAPRTVLLAFDADDAGRSATDHWSAELRRVGAYVRTMLPGAHAKDWNDVLQANGAEALRVHLAEITQELAGRSDPPMPSAPLRVCAYEQCRATPTVGYYCEEHDPFGPAMSE